ncbi:predicted protein [Nematostella vectensis]|uniref:Potassium channel domain-containing protein n=1 Tax=Nematostella vectensis TaxID=45351 RepID=A7S8V6_NEMVE|nr:predicted protein [Nematostella vectensis]|eukprot:XP_001631958.1 predicted protein [Nematostella vectensis]
MKKKKTFLLLIFAILLLLVKSQVFEDAVRNADCPTEPIIVHILSLPPYAWQVNNTHSAGIAFTFIRRGLEKCFSHCNASQPKYVFVNSTDELRAVLLQNATDIALPITSALENELDDGDDPTFDYYQKHPHLVFDSLVNSPGLSYVIHLGNTNDVVKNHMINALVEVWPVVIYCILLAGISGILVWVMEFKLNRSEFPKNFFHGSFEGFWWAFVSMTTVGYGDKTPKSVWGRLFGVAWILIGLVIIATFTAAATSALDSGMTYYKSGVDGKTVGVLEGTEAGVEALRKGATVKSYSTFRLMHEDLKHGKLDGLLLDRYEASHVMNTWQDDELRVLDTIDITIRYKRIGILGRLTAFLMHAYCVSVGADSWQEQRARKEYVSEGQAIPARHAREQDGARSHQTRQGIDQTRQGLDQTRQGIDKPVKVSIKRVKLSIKRVKVSIKPVKLSIKPVKIGDQISQGIDQTRHGIDQTRQGIDQTCQGINQTRQGINQTRQGIDQTRQGIDR